MINDIGIIVNVQDDHFPGATTSSQLTLTNTSSVGSFGESDDSSTPSFDTTTLEENQDVDADNKAFERTPDKDKDSKIKTHSR